MVTTAVRLPIEVGLVEKVTVSDVDVADVTDPTAPLLKVTVLLAAVVSKPVPAIVIVDALAPSAAVLLVTVGLTVATCTAEPLLTPFTDAWAVKLPALGLIEYVTVSMVVVAVVTVPTAPLFKVTMLLAAVVSKPKP